ADCIPVSIGEIEGNAGEILQIPVTCGDVTGDNITAFEMVLHFNPDSMQITTPAYSTTGSLCETGWNIFENPDNINGVLTIGGFGVNALSGSGCLIKVLAQIPANAVPATCSSLDIPSFVFNEGVPCVTLTSGRLCVLATAGILGCVRYYSGSSPLANLEIGITGGTPVVTDGSGCYEFAGLLLNESYTVTPDPCSSEFEPGNFISFYDASLAAQNAIGLLTLTELQERAADVSCNNDVSFFDASLIAQYAIDLIDAWPPECQCRAMIFEPSERAYDPLTGDQFNQDFTGILMGDVSGNWSPSSFLTMPPSAVVLLEEDPARPNSMIIRNHAASDAYSFEMEISCDHRELQFAGLELLGNAHEWQPYVAERDGVLKVGAFGTVAVPESQDMLRLIFESLASATCPTDIYIDKLMINESFRASANRTMTAQVAPQVYLLNQNYPNPFNSATTITYILSEKTFVSLAVYNSLGEVIAKLVDQVENAGQHEARFEANDLPTGLYFCELNAGGHRLVRKMMMIK
ncbi:MAG: T9SS type A sorting domain-containing protein, partial [Candidatus Zixiibacteriota bacterium]